MSHWKQKKVSKIKGLRSIIISPETVRKTIPLIPVTKMEASGFFTYESSMSISTELRNTGHF